MLDKIIQKDLGGTATVKELNRKTEQVMGLSEEICRAMHSAASKLTEVEYRLTWTRNYLKKAGIIVSPKPHVWSFAENFDTNKIDKTDVFEIKRQVRKIKTRIWYRIVKIWDYDDLLERTENDSSPYLENPKKALLEDAIRNLPTPAEEAATKAKLLAALKKAYDAEDVTLCLGAGVSMSAGVPLWNELINNMLSPP
jgi:restriction system protein